MGNESPPISTIAPPPLDMRLVVEAMPVTAPALAIRRIIGLPTKEAVWPAWLANARPPATTVAAARLVCGRQQLQRLVTPLSAILDRPMAIGSAIGLVVMSRRLPPLIVANTELAAASLVTRRKGGSHQRPARRTAFSQIGPMRVRRPSFSSLSPRLSPLPVMCFVIPTRPATQHAA